MTKYFAAFAVMLVLTFCGSLLSGTLTGRWEGTENQVELAARTLEQLPEEIGPWKAVKDEPLSENVLTTLQCSGYVNRTYFNEELGAYVNVALLLGPYGPICVHTPEICYSSRDYTADGERIRQTFQPVDVVAEDSLWKLNFKSNEWDDHRLQVYYGWSRGDRFEASNNPRWQFAGSPYLYKLQLSCSQRLDKESDTPSVAEQFIHDVLLEFKSHLVAPGNRRS